MADRHYLTSCCYMCVQYVVFLCAMGVCVAGKPSLAGWQVVCCPVSGGVTGFVTGVVASCGAGTLAHGCDRWSLCHSNTDILTARQHCCGKAGVEHDQGAESRQ
jgi:hypothetical protein